MVSFMSLTGMRAMPFVMSIARKSRFFFRDFPTMDAGEWFDWFFSSLHIFVQMPYGLTDPYTPL